MVIYKYDKAMLLYLYCCIYKIMYAFGEQITFALFVIIICGN